MALMNILLLWLLSSSSLIHAADLRAPTRKVTHQNGYQNKGSLADDLAARFRVEARPVNRITKELHLNVTFDNFESFLQDVEIFLDVTQSAIKKAVDASQMLLGVTNIDGFRIFLSVASDVLGKVAGAVSVAGAIVDIVLSFFDMATKKVDEFEKLRQELESISKNIKESVQEIKTSVTFNNWITTYILWEFQIRNGEAKLQEILQDIAATTDHADKIQLASDFVSYYENNDIYGAIRNIHRVAGQDTTVTTENIFELYCSERGHNAQELGQLMLVLSELILSGSRQSVTYYTFKYGVERAMKSATDIHSLLEDIRSQYERYMWFIYRDTIDLARAQTKKVIVENENDHEDVVGVRLYNSLASLYSWYQWAVVVVDQESLRWTTPYVTKGKNFFYVQEGSITVLVAWQDGTLHLSNCLEATEAHTLIFFSSNKDLDFISSREYPIYAGNNILSSQKCDRKSNSTKEIIGRYFDAGNLNALAESIKNRIRDILQSYGEENEDLRTSMTELGYIAQWVAVAMTVEYNPCENGDDCSGHGLCKHVPFTDSRMCLCYPGYYGDDCYHVSTVDSDGTFVDLLKTLRESFGESMQVPTLVDTYFAVNDMSHSFQRSHEKVMDMLEYLTVVVSDAEVINKAKYISLRYSQLLAGDISEDTFGLQLDALLTSDSIDYLMMQLQSAILGDGILNSEPGGLLTAYKRSLIAQGGSTMACSEIYANATKYMLLQLASLDEVVTESLLWYIRWYQENHPSTEPDQILSGAYDQVDSAQDRHNRYLNAWQRDSCPLLSSDTDLQQSFCDEWLSFEGMEVLLSCSANKTAMPESVECIRAGDTLQWSESPRCEHTWGDWGPWSSCSQTCGGGQMTRSRIKSDGEEDLENKECNSQDCCQKEYGKFKCDSEQCIDGYHECDGLQHCDDGSDEAHCTYLRSGDQVALRVNCGDGFRWLSCHGSDNDDEHACELETCPGHHFRNWANCRGEQFTVYSKSGDSEAIRHGDFVILHYRDSWSFSCYGEHENRCTLRNCPGNVITDSDFKCSAEVFRIMTNSPEGKGSCPNGDAHSDCTGQPILLPAEVFLWSRNRMNIDWVSGVLDEKFILKDDNDIKTRRCPGRYLEDNDNESCGCEKWMMFRKP